MEQPVTQEEIVKNRQHSPRQSQSQSQVKPMSSKPKLTEVVKEELINRLYMIKEDLKRLADSESKRTLIGETFTSTSLSKFTDFVDIAQSFSDQPQNRIEGFIL